jgi:PAS domain S-box-containing protein
MNGKQWTNSGENYHILFEQLTDAIMVTDFEGNFRDVNSSLCSMFGYSKEELLQMNVRALLDPENLLINPIKFDLLAAGEKIVNERKMVHKNGTIIYVQANSRKFMDNFVLAIARDITAKKKMEQVLRKSEANLQTIFDTTDTIYVLMDSQLRVISYNPRAVVFAQNELGQSIEISEYFLDYFPDDKRPVLAKHLKEALAGKQVEYEICYPQTEGYCNWYHVRMFPILKGNGDHYGIMMAVSDVTRHKLLEQELMTQKVQEQKNIIRAVLNAQETERNKIGLELHDNVNQLLTSVRLYLCMIEQEPDERMELIERAKEFVHFTIEEIRAISREQVTPQKKYNLKELIEELITDIKENTQSCTTFTCKVADYLPIDDDLKLNIYRIVQEQISNIVKYAAASSAAVHVYEHRETVNIFLTDDGKGFDPLQKRRGIGISNMINRVESYNGGVEIESNPGRGCKIRIRIPHSKR